ncbi:MAG: TrmJ/YjtD family RNA methyltransferase [Thermoplasmatales archaeon]
MNHIRVIFVEPKNPGNLGAIARIMKNFDVEDLVIVNAHRIPSEDIFRSMKGYEVLKKAKMVSSLYEASIGLTYLIGTSDVKGDSPKTVRRKYVTPRQFRVMLSNISGSIGIVLGREDIGLTNEELSMCDFFVHIPASSSYPTLNVSSAAAIILYELFRVENKTNKQLASRENIDALVSKFRQNLEANGYPKHRIEKTSLIFKRILTRSLLSDYEHRVLMGAIGCRR